MPTFQPHPVRTRKSRIPGPLLGVAMASLLSTHAFGWSASGTVKSTTGTAILGATVSVKDSATIPAATSGADGSFTVGSSTGLAPTFGPTAFSARIEGDRLVIHAPADGVIHVSLLDASGVSLWKQSANAQQGTAHLAIPTGIRFGAAFLRVRHADGVFYQGVAMDGAGSWKVAAHLSSARSLDVFPTLVAKATGYADTTFAMTAATQAGIMIAMRATAVAVADSFAEDHRSECAIPPLSAYSSLPKIANFPDPFTMLDGTKITTKAQWKCRAEEIGAMMEKYVMGDKMRKPTVAATMSGTKLAIAISSGGKTVTLNVTVTKPSGAGPFPAIIGYGGGNIGGYSGLAVATINYSPFDVASEGSGRGKGLYYDLYGSNATAGELMAWAWGVSRIIDAVAANPAFGIDAKHIAVTGCSRYGKGAVIAGVMDRRIALTIPQESGSGGVAAWRLIPVNSASQPIASTASEQCWLRADFPNNVTSSTVSQLPYDNHEMIAMVAPRGMLILDNSIDWLGPLNGYGSAVAGLEIFKALGAEQSLTYSSVGGHTHCSQPSSQDHWVKSYVQKFLLGGAGETAKIEAPTTYTFDKAKYVTWTTPTLQ